MNTDLAIYLSKAMLWEAMLISSPIIGIALLIGLVISLFQVITQIQDSTLSFVPKILAITMMLMISGEWMLHSLSQYTRQTIQDIPRVIR